MKSFPTKTGNILDRVASVTKVITSSDTVSALSAASIISGKVGTFTEPTKLIFLGASITNGMVSGYEDTMATYFSNLGYTVEVIDLAVSGDEISDILTRWESNKATYTSDASVWVFCHAGGNNVSNTRPYTSATNTEKLSIKTEYAQLLTSIVENGNTLLPANLTYRAYSDVIGGYEKNGSLPYNRDIFEPTINAVRTAYPNLCAPMIDIYRYTRAYYAAIGSDGVHYSTLGYDVLRYLVCDNAVSAYERGVTLTEVGDVVSGFSDLTPQTGILAVRRGSDTISTTMPRVFEGINSGTVYNIPSLNSAVPSGLTMSWVNGYSMGQNGGSLDDGDTSLSLTNDLVKEGFFYIGSSVTDFVKVATIGGLYPGQAVMVQVAAYRYSTETTRVGVYTVDDGVTEIKIDASTNNTGSHIGTMMGIADENGEVILKMKVDPDTSSEYAYANGIKPVPLA